MNFPHILLINPWVDDFAHYNLWSAPLGLYKVAQFLSSYHTCISVVDLMDAPADTRPDGRGHLLRRVIDRPASLPPVARHFCRYGMEEGRARLALEAEGPVDAVLVTSHMTYWYTGVTATVRLAREIFPGVPVIAGGIYATLCEAHARAHLGAEEVLPGRVDHRLVETLKRYGCSLSFRGERQHWSRFVRPRAFATILTSYGCPFRCAYCAAHTLSGPYAPYRPQRVVDEICLLYDQGVRTFAFYDEALLVNAADHILPILTMCAKRFPEARFVTPVGLHARFVTREVARLMRACGFYHIRLGLETADSERQMAMGGKADLDSIEQAVELLVAEGFQKKEIGIFVMYGLPGEPLLEVDRTVEAIRPLGVRIHLSEYSPVPGTELFNEVDSAVKKEPLLANNTIYSSLYANYDREVLEVLRLKVKRHNEGFSEHPTDVGCSEKPDVDR